MLCASRLTSCLTTIREGMLNEIIVMYHNERAKKKVDRTRPILINRYKKSKNYIEDDDCSQPENVRLMSRPQPGPGDTVPPPPPQSGGRQGAAFPPVESAFPRGPVGFWIFFHLIEPSLVPRGSKSL